VLGERLVGLYVYGSVATGGFIDGLSDIDRLAAVSRDVDHREFDALQLMHARTGRQISKHEAARWAQEALPEWAPVIERALEWRRDAPRHAQPEDEAAFQETSAFVHFAADLIRPSVMPGAPPGVPP